MNSTADALRGVEWFTSSYSNDQGGNCVEGARLAGGVMAVRDSKVPSGPATVFEGGAWTSFLVAVKATPTAGRLR